MNQKKGTKKMYLQVEVNIDNGEIVCNGEVIGYEYQMHYQLVNYV